jgi:FAD/FMN-containing dehydrogenase
MPKYQWDIGDPLTCVEVVFGTGDLFRTGASAGPGSLEEQWQAGSFQKEAAGPSSASWYRIVQGGQGTMGIVTWASMRCEISPKLETSFLVGARRPEVLMDLMHWLVRRRLVNESFILNRVNLAAISAESFPDDYLKIKEGLPPWILFFNVAAYDYLPEERVDGQVKDIMGIAQGLGVTPVDRLGEIAAADLRAKVQAPSVEPYWKLRSLGGCQDVFFLSIRKHLPRLMETMQACAAGQGFPVSEMGVYLQPVAQGTAWHCEFNLFFDPGDSEASGRVERLHLEAVKRLMERGAFFSRPYGGSAGMVFSREPSNTAALKKVKAIVDPDGIMNPGQLCF